MTPTDPLYGQQWHFSLIGNIEKVWDDYDGTGVTVVIYDEGVEYTHPDLAANFDNNFFTYNGVVYDPMPIDANSGHGTSCAGLFGAVAGNGIGGVGVAPGITFGAVNYLDDIQFQSQDVYDAAMLWAAQYDIMSNSWGWGGSYTKAQNLTNTSGTAYHDMQLWETLVSTGRDGLGTVIVKAAGNETNNVNGDGWNVNRFSATIAATDNFGNATYYTNYGSAILIAGPASAVTTDMTGDQGYNRGGDGDPLDPDYTSEFNGTSAATPTVAGVVALMLDANEGLGWRDVMNILALSAHHTGSALGGAKTTYEIGTWTTMGGTLWNGGGTEYHQSYGYGMLDAFAAVRYAEAWSAIYPGTPLTSANELSASFDYTGATKAIPDSDGVAGTGQVSMAMVSTSTIQVESIEVTIKMTHAKGTDLTIWLQAPDGKMIELFNGDGNALTWRNGTSWTFGVDVMRGYSAEGTWSVIVEDKVTGNTGTLQDASITFYGSAATVNDVYNFTQDYALMSAYEASRRTLVDTDGGKDTLNFASIEQGITATLAFGGTIAFGGTQVATIGGSADTFEKFYAGDGADSIIGNTLGNEIWGARANDSLRGANGNDTLWGGVGNDQVKGENGKDTLHGGDGNDAVTGGKGDDLLWGEAGKDNFVFGVGTGADTVQDWQDNTDKLKLDDAAWGGGLSIQQVIDSFASVIGGNAVFDFGTTKVTLVGVTDLASLSNDIILV